MSNNNQPKVLTESYPVKLQLQESEGDRLVAKGKFGECGEPTANGRVYRRPLIEREIQRLQPKMQNRSLFGECDHPCFTSNDFRVLTKNGWKDFDDIEVGDKVWSRKNGDAVLSEVNDIINEEYSGTAYRISNSKFETEVTPDHRFLVHSKNETRSNNYIKAKDLYSDSDKYSNYFIPKGAKFVRAERSNKKCWLNGLEVEKTEHNGKIYCLNVEHDNFYVEQNGSCFWTGNSSGQTQLKRVSHIITDLQIENNGDVIGELEIIEDTQHGSQLAALVRNGCQIGVSSRGVGSVKEQNGNYIVQEDFKLYTYDCVADPSVDTALPDFGYHSQDKSSTGSQIYMPDSAVSEGNNIDIDNLKYNNPEVYQSLKEEFMSQENDSQEASNTISESEEDITEHIENKIEEGLEKIESKFAENFERARKDIQESIDSSEEGESSNSSELKEYTEKLMEAVKAAGAELVLNEHLHYIREEDKQDFIDLVGSPDDFDSVEELSERAAIVANRFYEEGKYLKTDPDTVDSLRERVKNLNLELETHKDVLREARQEINEIQDEYEFVCEEYERRENEIESLQEDLDSSKQVIQKIRKEREQKDQKIEKLQSKLESKNSVIDSKQEIIEQKEEQIESYEKKMDRGRKNFDALREQKKNKESKLEEMKEKYQELKSEKESLDESLQNYKKELKEKDLEVYKRDKVLGTKNPNRAYSVINEATSKSHADSLIEDYRESQQKEVDNPSGINSDSQKDNINEDKVKSQLFGDDMQQKIMENFEKEKSTESAKNFDKSDVNSEESLKIVESDGESGLNSSSESANQVLDSLSPERAKELMKRS